MLRQRFSGARLSVLTRDSNRGILQGYRWIGDVHALPPDFDLLFSHASLLQNLWRLSREFKAIQGLKAGIALAPAPTRDILTDAVMLATGATLRAGWEGRTDADSPSQVEERRYFYTHLLDPAGAPPGGRHRFTAFAGRLGLDSGPMPLPFLPDAEAFAAADLFLDDHGLDPDRTLIAFPGQWPRLLAPGTFFQLVEGALAGSGWDVLLLGSIVDGFGLSGQDPAKGRNWVRAFGKLDWVTVAALMARVHLSLGYEGDWVHLAGAVGRPHVVLAGGGGNPGDLPYSPWTTLVSRPLDCDGCGWQCRYPHLHCLEDLRPKTLETAVRLALQGGRPHGVLDQAGRVALGDPAPRPSFPDGTSGDVAWIGVT